VGCVGLFVVSRVSLFASGRTGGAERWAQSMRGLRCGDARMWAHVWAAPLRPPDARAVVIVSFRGRGVLKHVDVGPY